MPSGNPNINQYRTNGLDKNPQNINRNGRPRKTFRTFIEKCKAEGMELISKNDYMNVLNYLMSMTDDELKEISKDVDQPQWIKWILTDLKNVNLRGKMQIDLRDWVFGKSQENVKVEGNISTDINITIDGKNIDEIEE